jgi:hypothetical protein
MIFLTLEKALNAVEILRKRFAKNCDLNIENFDAISIYRNGDEPPSLIYDVNNDDLDCYKNYYIVELKEGQGFGPELSIKDEFAFVV